MQDIDINIDTQPETIVITKSIDLWYQEATISSRAIKDVKGGENLTLKYKGNQIFDGIIGSVSESFSIEGTKHTIVARTKNWPVEYSSYSRDDVYWSEDPTLEQYLKQVSIDLDIDFKIDKSCSQTEITPPDTNPGTNIKSAILAACRSLEADVWSIDGKTLQIGKYKANGLLKADSGVNIIEWEKVKNNFNYCHKYSLFGQSYDGDYLEYSKSLSDAPFKGLFCTSISTESSEKELKAKVLSEIERRKRYANALYLTIKGWNANLLESLKWRGSEYLVHSLRHTFSFEDGFRTQMNLFKVD